MYCIYIIFVCICILECDDDEDCHEDATCNSGECECNNDLIGDGVNNCDGEKKIMFLLITQKV